MKIGKSRLEDVGTQTGWEINKGREKQPSGKSWGEEIPGAFWGGIIGDQT